MKFGVVVFPGSNCDHDAFCAVENAPLLRLSIPAIPHRDREQRGTVAVHSKEGR